MVAISYTPASDDGAHGGHGHVQNADGLKRHADYREVKRMWVDASCRGMGIGRRILRGHGPRSTVSR